MSIQESWTLDKFKNRRHEPVFRTLDALRNQQQERLRLLEIYRLLYSDDACNGFNTGITSQVSQMRSGRSQFSENLIRSVIDTVCAKIGKNSPKPFCVSNGGDGQLRRKGKNLNKYLLGKFDQLKVSNTLRSILRAACIEGTGAGKICIDYQTKDLTFERTPIHQLFVDQSEAQYCKPSQLFQVMPANKELLMKLYPKQALQIKASSPPTYTTHARQRKDPVLVEQVELIEAFKLPDTADEPGRHVICTSQATLLDEEWEELDFPFIFLHANGDPLQGFWGEGFAKMLMEIQFRVNYTLLQIQESLRLCSKPTWLINSRSNVVPGHIRNVIGNQLVYKDVEPKQVVFPSVAPEVFQWLQDQRQRAFEIAGISQMSAESKKPSGITAAIALETLNDIESERFVMLGKALESAAIDVAEKIVSLTKREYDKEDDDEVKDTLFKSFYSRSWEVSEVKWSEVDMRRDQFNLSVLPVSSLPQSVAGRQQQVQDWLQAGMIDPASAMELLDFPDTRRWQDLRQAAHDNAEKLVEDVLYDGANHVVEPTHDVTYLLQYAQQMYNQTQLTSDDEEKLERLRQLMDQCHAILDQVQAAQQPPAQPAPPTQGEPLQ